MKLPLFLQFCVLVLLLSLISCAANKVIVHVETTDNLGLPLEAVEVKVVDVIQCCAGEDRPCSFFTKDNGNTSFAFVTGRALISEPVRKEVCKIEISKIGHETLREEFNYCVAGPCSGEQNIMLKYILLPSKKSAP